MKKNSGRNKQTTKMGMVWAVNAQEKFPREFSNRYILSGQIPKAMGQTQIRFIRAD